MKQETLSDKRKCLKHIGGYREKCGEWVFSEGDVKEFIEKLKERYSNIPNFENWQKDYVKEEIDKLAGRNLV